MEMNKDEPSIQLNGLSIWIDGYEFAKATNYWDANWVNTRIKCLGKQSVVELCDSCVRLPELEAWAEACKLLLDDQAETAPLAPMEPYLDVTIHRDAEFLGLAATVKITPDNTTEFHEFRFRLDKSDVARLIQDITVVLSKFPVRGTKPG